MSRSEQVVQGLTLRKQTPLYPAHRAAGARMVDFGGWDMPVHYSSQIEEHHAVRRDAGMFDVSHMRVLDVLGENARALLRRALANNVDKLEVAGKALYSCLLRPDGGVIDDLIVYFLHENAYRLVVNAGTAEKDSAWLRELMATHEGTVQLTMRNDLAIIAVQGPRAREKVWQALPETRAVTESLKPFSAIQVGELFIARTGYTGEDGFEIMLPDAHAPAVWEALATVGVRPCGLGARDTLRLEAGMNLYGQDMDETVSPLACGLKWTVDLASERDFIGKAALLANRIECHQWGLILLEPGGVLRSHQKVDTPAGAGEITSGTFSPTLNRSIALARVPFSTRSGDKVKVAVREKLLVARVVKPPFVRAGRVLIDLQESS